MGGKKLALHRRKEACNLMLTCLHYSGPGCDSIRDTNHGPGCIKLFVPTGNKSHFRKRSSNRRNLKTPTLCLRVDRKRLAIMM